MKGCPTAPEHCRAPPSSACLCLSVCLPACLPACQFGSRLALRKTVQLRRRLRMSRRQGVHNTPASPGRLPPSENLSIFAWMLPMRTSDGAAHGFKDGVILGTALLSLTPCEHMTTERSSQLPAVRCRASWSSEARLPPNCVKRWRRKEECVTTAMHFSGRALSHCRKATARSQQCSSDSRSLPE
eukprot:scaffold66128_cov66-Phaeocystis_antarctica.AAC.1